MSIKNLPFDIAYWHIGNPKFCDIEQALTYLAYDSIKGGSRYKWIAQRVTDREDFDACLCNSICEVVAEEAKGNKDTAVIPLESLYNEDLEVFLNSEEGKNILLTEGFEGLENAFSFAQEKNYWKCWLLLLKRPDLTAQDILGICEEADHADVWDAGAELPVFRLYFSPEIKKKHDSTVFF